MYSASVTHGPRIWLRALFGRRPTPQPPALPPTVLRVLDLAAENKAIVYEDAETRRSYAVNLRRASTDVSETVDRLVAAGYIRRGNLYGPTAGQRRNWQTTAAGDKALIEAGRIREGVPVEAVAS